MNFAGTFCLGSEKSPRTQSNQILYILSIHVN